MFRFVTLHIAEVLLSLTFILGGAATLRQPEGRAAQLQKFHHSHGHPGRAVKWAADGHRGSSAWHWVSRRQ